MAGRMPAISLYVAGRYPTESQRFRKRFMATAGGRYQTLIDAALREYVSAKREPLEATLRRVLHEDFAI